MFDIRRLIGGLSALCILIGALLVCFVYGGLFNQYQYPYSGTSEIRLDHPLHIMGFVLAIIGAVGFVVLFSFKRPEKTPPSNPESRFSEKEQP